MKKFACGLVCFAAFPVSAYDHTDVPAAEYEAVDSITSSGAQYINTGFTPNASTSVRMEFETGAYANNTAFFGTGWNTYRWRFYQYSNKYYFGGNNTDTAVACSNYKDATLTVGNGSMTLELNGATTTKSVSLTNNGGVLYIFSVGTANCSSFRLKSFEIRQSGDIVHYYQPAVRRADLKPGLYDCVTGDFLVNQGTGADFSYEGNAAGLKLEMDDRQDYTGAAVEPAVVVRNASTGEAIPPSDCNLAFTNNVDSGIATVWVVSTNAACRGAIHRDFAIYRTMYVNPSAAASAPANRPISAPRRFAWPTPAFRSWC